MKEANACNKEESLQLQHLTQAALNWSKANGDAAGDV
jgi:hypothetical protein